MGDNDVLSYLYNSLEENSNKLEKALKDNKIEEVNKIKEIILGISKKISEELK